MRLSDLDDEALAALVDELGEKRFRVGQLRRWTLGAGVFDPEDMTDLPRSFRQALAERVTSPPLQVADRCHSDDGTDKLLFGLADGQNVEAVMIPSTKRTTICLSSQVGCAVQCVFCASGVGGGKRNLTRGEIVEQFLAMKRHTESVGRRVTNVVMMGMGEPMFNYRNVMSALDALRHPDGRGLGARRITVSTVGIRGGVKKFTEAKTQYTLAFSLHAPDDELRGELVPLEGAMTVDEIRDAAMRYLETTGREVTFEYVLLGGVNDSAKHAHRLVRRFRRVRGMVNLIPYNPVSALPYDRPTDADVDRFAEILEGGSLRVSVRRRKGSDIAAACGQLAFEKTLREDPGSSSSPA